jgi:hypothetical protein
MPCSDQTISGGNPQFKVYDVDPDTYEIMDARVFMSALSSPDDAMILNYAIGSR